MIQIVHDEPGGNHRYVLAQAVDENTLWIEFDQPPPETELYDHWDRPPYKAIAAAAARLAYPIVSGNDLYISTLQGFGGDAQKRVELSDHTEQTLLLATRCRNPDYDDKGMPSQIIIAGLSAMYERALTVIGGTIPKAGFEKAVELVSSFAGSALSHVLYDLQKSSIPTLVGAWDVPAGTKKTVPFVPMSVKNFAKVTSADKFSLEEWREYVNGR